MNRVQVTAGVSGLIKASGRDELGLRHNQPLEAQFVAMAEAEDSSGAPG